MPTGAVVPRSRDDLVDHRRAPNDPTLSYGRLELAVS
jgi:hypothetical protein